MESAVEKEIVEEKVDEKEVCEICGKEFTGFNRAAQIAGHMRSHTSKTRERIEGDTKKKERVPFSTHQRKFTCPDDKDFNYRVFNDKWAKEPGRIKRALEAGYEIVEGHERYPVGTNEDGTPITGILMKIPKEFFEEDQAIKQKEVDKVDEQILKGSLEQKPGDHRYSPDGIRITSGTTEPK